MLLQVFSNGFSTQNQETNSDKIIEHHITNYNHKFYAV